MLSKRPPLAHRIIGAGQYVPADAHITTDDLRRVFKAARRANPNPIVVRVGPAK